MDWIQPYYLLAFPPAALLLWWFHRRSLRPMSTARRRALLAVRCLLLLLLLAALAGPAVKGTDRDAAVIFIVDHSQSQGTTGMQAAEVRLGQLVEELPDDTQVGFLSAGQTAQVLRAPGLDRAVPELDATLPESDGGRTDLAAAVDLACGLFPPVASRRIVLIGDGLQTHGDLESAARNAALQNVAIDAAPVAGLQRPDVRVVRLTSSRSRSDEGASIELRAEIDSSLAGEGVVRLFENGVEVDRQTLELTVGQQQNVSFLRTPQQRNLYTYRARIEGFDADAIAENDEAMALVDVRGRPRLLYVEGQKGQADDITQAMAAEGIRLELRTPETFPQTLQQLSGFDGVVFSDVAAHRLSAESMGNIKDYVETFGGGFVMIGGKNSFGAGGYYQTAIEEVLPVKMRAPDDKEERMSVALGLVIDRSGSMSGQKIELCKSAAVATVDLLSSKDYVTVVSFDSSAHVVVPITRVDDKGTINGQIAQLSSGGGTNMQPGMTAARQALSGVKAKAKHMIVLSDGQTNGGGYRQMATEMKAEGITVSTVGIGSGFNAALMQTIAAAGGGQFYHSFDPTNLPRIFTQDAMVHLGRLIREDPFQPKQVEPHPMLKGFPVDQAPDLLGYVKTNPKSTAQVPLVTDLADPLLAHWQYGLGKVTAFTSDCKSNWSVLWIEQWQTSFSQFWAQVFRETAREPQSRTMDISLVDASPSVEIGVDLLHNPAQFADRASVTADVYFRAAGALGSSTRHLEQVQLSQSAPGRYTGSFLPAEPGVYLVRARSAGKMVSAGHVHRVSGETASGRVDLHLLERVCKLAGGSVLADSQPIGLLDQTGNARPIDLTPALLRLLLLLFLADVAIRRWENVMGMVSIFQRD